MANFLKLVSVYNRPINFCLIERGIIKCYLRSLLSLQSAVQKIGFLASQGASQILVAKGQSLSSPDADLAKTNSSKTIENKGGNSLSGTAWHVLSKIEKWCAVQGLNLLATPIKTRGI